ncbi:CDP-alcohol phosphatidyltransferase family protein [bacterium]|nr:CDP-alcohol phosphatidyltransferase family protein [bacterium]
MVENQIEKQIPETLTDKLRAFFKLPLEKIGLALYDLGIRPNMITLTGLLGTLVGALFVAKGQLFTGGAFILAMGALDALDGAVARASGSVSKFGGFLDSVTDRYIEAFIYGGLVYYFGTQQNELGMLLSFLAMAGSILVSYTRARAQSLGFETKVGILTRVERMLVIGPAIILNIPVIGVGVVAVFANITAIQRIFHVKQQAELEE